MIAYNKYRVAPKANRTIDGITFASKGEMFHWLHLKNLQRAGDVRNLRRQVVYKLALPDGTPIMVGKRQAIYRPDFVYELRDINNNWHEVLSDYKGVMTQDARFRISVFEALTGKKVLIVK